jgi:hypothetical protein
MKEILFNHFTFIPKSKHKIGITEVSVDFHNMPENWTIADIYHRFGTKFSLFPKPGSKTAAKNHGLHINISLILFEISLFDQLVFERKVIVLQVNRVEKEHSLNYYRLDGTHICIGNVGSVPPLKCSDEDTLEDVLMRKDTTTAKLIDRLINRT